MLRASQKKELKPEMHLTPGGALEVAVHKDVAASTQKRINALDNKLYGELDKIRQERARVVNQGYAKAQFNQKSRQHNIQP